jgi:hypothetical protein
MHPQEVWKIYDVKRPHDPSVDYAGKLTDGRCEEMYQRLIKARRNTEDG